MKRSQEYRNMRSWTAGAALVLALGLALPASSWAEPKIRNVTGIQQGGTDVVRVELSETSLKRDIGVDVRVGQPVEVFFTTGRRSILSYAIKPLLDQLRKAARE